ncbi:RING finger protein 17 [Bicyclus anynana]|uniref:RING finger protein 17 n=1 Tax=Bicyclus anynana TaxID=110368 RepID=A0A6J1MPV5_BICAN|nr:RING finger protein 17 [Bicyclus anynana]
MDEKIKKCCPNCCQLYQLKATNSKFFPNLPLFLTCGHSTCENCVRNLVKFGEPIDCKICLTTMQLDAADADQLVQNKVSLYKLFPVNVYMVGELALQHMEIKDSNKEIPADEYYTDIKSIINNVEIQDECIECHGPTSKMCQQCVQSLCKDCFNKTHMNFAVFKTHVLRNIESSPEIFKCNVHTDTMMGFYCKDCSKFFCVNCALLGERACKDHDVITIREANEKFASDLSDLAPKVDEILRRLTNTSVDIGNLLTKLHNEGTSSQYVKMFNNVEQHYSKINAIIQKQKDDITNKLFELKGQEMESLYKTKDIVCESIKKAKSTLNDIISLDLNRLNELNLMTLIDKAMEVVNTPWYLHCDDAENTLNLVVKDDLYSLIDDYIKVEGNASPKYGLYTHEELAKSNKDIPPVPKSIVYPPELVKDVRQKTKLLNKPADRPAKKPVEAVLKQSFIKDIPQYRSSKGGSTNSLNSNNSDTSQKKYVSYDQRRPVACTTPFQVTPEPKQLQEGAQELVYVSHIVDPNKLYAQRVCLQSTVQELLREFRNAGTLPRPSLKHVAIGKVYLVHIKADAMWHRCRIDGVDDRSTDKPLYKVFCIDFGNTEIVSIDELRLIPVARLQSPPPLAIECCLANCQPIDNWSNDAALLIQKIIDNKRAVMYIRRILSVDDGILRVECDITTFEGGVSVAHALAFQGFARMPNSNLTYPKMMTLCENPKIYVTNDYKQNSIEDVVITHVESPDVFFVRKCHHPYEKLCEDMNREYRTGDSKGSVYLPEKDAAYAVLVSGRGMGTVWARGVVQELSGRRARVLLCDSGERLLVRCDQLRRLHAKFTTLKALATQCHLVGIKPINKKWSPQSGEFLQTFKERPLELHVEDNRSHESVGVILFDNSEEDNIVCINELMVNRKFAYTYGLYMFNNKSPMEELVHNNKDPLEKPKKAPKKQNAITILQQNKPIPKKRVEVRDKGPLRIEAKVVNYQSPGLIYVSLVHQKKLFHELFEKIQQHYADVTNNSGENKEWQVGDRCCTICTQSRTWRRASVLAIEDDSAKVFYSDFGCTERVPLSGLRELDRQFTAVGDAAILCHLSGVIPAGGDDWPSMTKEYLKELIDVYQRLYITKVGDFKGKSMPVELWVYHTTPGGALEPDTSEWRCLNKKIIEQGLALPDKLNQIPKEEATTGDSNSAAGDDVLSFLNITGSIHDWLQIEPMPMKPLSVDAEPETNNSQSVSQSTCEDVEKQEQPNSSNTVYITDWLPPKPLECQEFTATPTFVDDNGVIYLHDVSQEETFDLIRNGLDARFKDPDPKAKYVKWTVGEPCIAMFFLDKCFHRGRVVAVNYETSTCTIHYIDYGNEDECAFENIRKSTALYPIPIQAYKCMLKGIRPVGKKWDRMTLDFIHKNIVDKQTFVKVAGEPIGGILPIELKCGELYLNDHLVHLEMAEYTDEARNVVRQFIPTTEGSETNTETNSGPDYIIEDSDIESVESQVQMRPFDLDGKNWYEIMQEDEMESTSTIGRYVTYTSMTESEFLCHIKVLYDINKLELIVMQDHDTTVMYTEMEAQLQKDSNKPAINGVYENKACLVLFPQDGQWYRAMVLQYSEAKKLVKVKYVDYGKIEVTSLENLREIDDDYLKLPTATLTATLYGYTINSSLDEKVVAGKFTETFLNKDPFHVKIIKNDVLPSVELKDIDGKLVYENLITENVLLPCD